MILNVTYDSSVGSAPAGFTDTINSAISFFQTNFNDPVTVNIAVGYGEIDGQTLSAGALGESLTFMSTYSYAQLKSALAADATSPADSTAVASLPISDPTGGTYWVAQAEAKALGLSAGSGLDGYIGFNGKPGMFDYDNSNGVSSGTYDFFGTFVHEVTEVMGRQLLVGQTVGGLPNGYDLLDLFHFSASGVRNFLGIQAGYFSVDNGATNLDNFNTSPGADFGDWASSAGSDSYRAFATSGVVAAISNADMKVMDAIGWDVAALPDLTVTNFVVNISTVSFTINNTGSDSAPPSAAGIYLSADSFITGSDILLTTTATPALTAGTGDNEVVSIAFPTNLAPGTYYLGALTDYDGQVVESHEGNNASNAVPVILGNDIGNSLIGTSGRDTMFGFSGNDSLNGGAGNDTMIGGTGDDTYIVDSTSDVVSENPAEGTDIVLASASYTLAVNVENLNLTGSAAINGTGNAGANTIVGNTGNNILAGLAGADTLDGGAGIDTASYAASAASVNISLATGLASGGDAAGDVLLNIENLTGSAFNDTIEGDAGNNVLIGGAGVDMLSYEHATGAVTVSLALTTAQNTGSAGIDTVTQFENLTGSAYGDTLTGSAGNNLLSGGDGNDRLIGGGGIDTMIGGTGDDTYVVDSASDVVKENPGEGTDIVLAAASYTLAVNVENLNLTGSAAINGTGNAGANTIVGNTGNNILAGLAGADTLDGGAGIDTASYAASAASANISLATGLASGGDAAGDVLLNIENLTGSAFNDTIEGDAGNNVLIGGAGVDMLSYEHATGAVTVSLALTTAQNTGSAGIDTVTQFENLTGSAYGDTLTGSAGNNLLSGGDGNDSLIGGGGIDTMIGGTGDDTYVVDSAGDVVKENPGEGTDTVLSSVTYTLGVALENLNLTGSAAINGTGNAGANTIAGNTGNNILAGLAGADTLDGGAGIDTASYAASSEAVNVALSTGLGSGGDAAGDVLLNIENLTGSAFNDTIEGDAGNNVLIGGAGVDMVSYEHATGAVTVSLALTTAQNTGSAGIDTVTQFENLTGSAYGDTLTGSAGNNLLSGGDGDDSLDGSSGNDTIAGGAGADTMTGGSGADRFVFNDLSDFASGAVFDKITDFSHAQADKIDLSGVDANGLLAGDQAFVFIGTQVFHGIAGELHYASNGIGITVSGDLDGDTVADFSFDVNGLPSPVGSDFIL